MYRASTVCDSERRGPFVRELSILYILKCLSDFRIPKIYCLQTQKFRWTGPETFDVTKDYTISGLYLFDWHKHRSRLDSLACKFSFARGRLRELISHARATECLGQKAFAWPCLVIVDDILVCVKLFKRSTMTSCAQCTLGYSLSYFFYRARSALLTGFCIV